MNHDEIPTAAIFVVSGQIEAVALWERSPEPNVTDTALVLHFHQQSYVRPKGYEPPVVWVSNPELQDEIIRGKLSLPRMRAIIAVSLDDDADRLRYLAPEEKADETE